MYKQFVLRLPDSLKAQMHERVQAGKLDGVDFIQQHVFPLERDKEKYRLAKEKAPPPVPAEPAGPPVPM
jgi:hypothetical protein